MNKCVILMCFLGVAMLSSETILCAEGLPSSVPVVSPDKTISGDKGSDEVNVDKNKDAKLAESKPVGSETPFIKIQAPEVPFDESVNEGKRSNKNKESGQIEPKQAEMGSTPPSVKEEPPVESPAELISGKEVSDKSAMGEEAAATESAEGESEPAPIKDPLQSFNRAMFTFNDKAFHYFFKPIYTGYNSMVPEQARVGVRNFYSNIKMPVRFFNCLFQANFKGAGTEMLRFVINSTVGVAGFTDPAKSKFHIEKQERDFGQTLGKYNMKSGTYLVLPFFGPSNTRDAVGLAGDSLLNPITWVSYFFLVPIESIGNYTYDSVNDLSVDKGNAYENITQSAIDPYIAVQDAYTQYRNRKIKEALNSNKKSDLGNEVKGNGFGNVPLNTE